MIQSLYQYETEASTIEYITEVQFAKELREKYIKNPPEGITSDEVRSMSDDELLDMDYFFHEFDDTDDDDFGEELSYKKRNPSYENLPS